MQTTRFELPTTPFDSHTWNCYHLAFHLHLKFCHETNRPSKFPALHHEIAHLNELESSEMIETLMPIYCRQLDFLQDELQDSDLVILNFGGYNNLASFYYDDRINKTNPLIFYMGEKSATCRELEYISKYIISTWRLY